MKRRIIFFLSALIVVGCGGGGGGSNNPVTAPTLTAINIFVATATQLKAIGTYSDGSTKDITTSVTWASSDVTVATVDASGNLTTGSVKGTTYITASMGGLKSAGYPYTTSSGTVSVPSAPTIVIATSGDTIRITWNSVSGAQQYNLYNATQSGVKKSNYISLPAGARVANVTSPYKIDFVTMPKGTALYFVVTAVNSAGESIESNEVSGTVTSAMSFVNVDTVPSNTCVSVNKQVQLTAEYTDPAGIQSYNWSASCGAIIGSGALVTYLAPSAPDICRIIVTITNNKGEKVTGNAGLYILSGCP